jgi:hypothetical protein
MSKEVGIGKEIVQEQVFTKEEMVQYLKQHLRLEVKSERVAPNESRWTYQITLKLEGQQISGVQFVA